MTGTVINIITVAIGSAAGILLKNKLPEKYKMVILQAVGMITLVIGMQMALKTQNILIILGSILLGALSGQWIDIDNALKNISEKLKKKFINSNDAYFTEGLITASIIFCVGPMTILGSFNDGLYGDYELLAIKSVMDGFTSVALAASFGIGVFFSVITILIFQGTLTLTAVYMQSILSELMISEMSAVGGVLILGIGIVILDIKKVKIANFLPSLIFVPFLLYLKNLLF